MDYRPPPGPRSAADMKAEYARVKRDELAVLERDAAISLLLETPVECSTRAPLSGRCGLCWTCLVDKFLRDVGARR